MLVNRSPLCTKLENAAGFGFYRRTRDGRIGGCGIHNALIEIDGPRFRSLTDLLSRLCAESCSAGVRRWTHRAAFEVMKTSRDRRGRRATLSPADTL